MTEDAFYWIQLVGWIAEATGALGGVFCAIRGFHHWLDQDWKQYFRSLVALFGFIVLAAIGISLTLIGPQQI